MKLSRYQGVVESLTERFFFIRFGGYPKAIFAHWNSLSEPEYDLLESGQSVSFQLRFNRKGPVAIDVRRV